MSSGYIKLYRKTIDNPIIMKDSEHLAVWIYLLVEATHKEMDALFKGKRITLQPGQLITGTKSIGMKLKINYLKVYRILNEFESEKQIEKQTSNRNSIITINNWCMYQDSEKQNETLLKNKCKTTEKLLKTNKNNKNDKNNKNERNINNIYEQEFSYLWSIYPRKIGKSDAEKKYYKHRQDGYSYEEILEGLQNYISYIKRNGTKQEYIKHGSTWFNQKGWLDTYADEETKDPQLEILKGIYNGEIKIN